MYKWKFKPVSYVGAVDVFVQLFIVSFYSKSSPPVVIQAPHKVSLLV